MKNIGAWLIIAFGCLLTVGSIGTGGADVGEIRNCGGGVGVGAIPPCDVGSIAVTKSIVGTGSAPAGGWTVTIGSTNCAAGLVGRSDLVLTIPSAGGVGTVAGLFVATDNFGATLCQYTVTETAVAGWTSSFVPPGPTYTVANRQTTSIALTNTATPTTTTTTTTTIAATTTTIAPATTTIAATTTTIAPTTTIAATTTTIAPATTSTSVFVATTALPTTIATIAAPSTTAAGPSTTPTVPAAIALPATGSRSTRPTTYIGIALIGLGTLILVNRRRHSNSPTD